MIGKQGCSSELQEFDPTTLSPSCNSKSTFSDHGGRRWEGLANRLESRKSVMPWMEQRGINEALKRQSLKPHLTEGAQDREGEPRVRNWNEHNPRGDPAHPTLRWPLWLQEHQCPISPSSSGQHASVDGHLEMDTGMSSAYWYKRWCLSQGGQTTI